MPTSSRQSPAWEEVQSLGPAQTKKFAQKVSKEPLSGALILLQGPVGAGKTTFTQALARALGVTELVRSPTFVLLKSYTARKGGLRRLIHIDAYRLSSFQELQDLGGIEHLGDPDTLTVVEWPKGKKLDWPNIPTYTLRLIPSGATSRRLLLRRP